MKSLIFVYLLIALHVNSRSMFYNILPASTSYYQCYRESGFDRIILPIIQTKDGIYQDEIQNAFNAKSSGLSVQIVFIPCRVRTVDQELQMLFKSFGSLVDRYWVNPSQSKSVCGWSNFSPEVNCQYLQQLLTKMRQNFNTPIEVAADRISWNNLFKSTCWEVGNSLLWWVPKDQEADSQPNFDSYRPFGGWVRPYMKLFSSRTICGTGLFESYYE